MKILAIEQDKTLQDLIAGSAPIFAAQGVAADAGRVHIVWVQRLQADETAARAHA